MPNQADIKLEYVTREGRVCRVSEFAHLSPRDRPAVFCPECQAPLTLKLGTRKRHHAAHRPDSLCILTKPETVLHLNTKIYLHGLFTKSKELYVNQFCSGWTAPDVGFIKGGPKDCQRHLARPYLWLKGWDAIEQERRIESRKPDLVFYREGKPIAALEVFATHAVDESKSADLARLGVPWLEVKASAELYEGPERWNPADPLPYVRVGPPLPLWTCEHCQASPARYVERTERSIKEGEARRRADAQRLQEELRRKREEADKIRRYRPQPGPPQSKLWPRDTALSKLIYLYANDGQREPFEYFVVREDGRTSLVFGRDAKLLYSEPGEFTEAVWADMIRVYREHRDAFTRRAQHTVHVTGWVIPTEVGVILTRWRSPYLWNSSRNAWEEA